jgi:hypothetical protein
MPRKPEYVTKRDLKIFKSEIKKMVKDKEDKMKMKKKKKK